MLTDVTGKSLLLLTALSMMMPIAAGAAVLADERVSLSPIISDEGRDAEVYKYSTSDDVVIRGVVGLPGQNQDESSSPIPEEVFVPAGTQFEIVDRVTDDNGVNLVYVSLSTGDAFGSRLELVVLESELARSLSPENKVAFNLDELEVASSKFYYMGGSQVAGPSTLTMPVKGARRTSPPGMRLHPILKRRKFHAGWDLAAPTGTPVVAAASGVVASAGWGGGYGNLIILRHGNLETRYAHLSKILVSRGQSVSQGQVIGKVGSTGRSTGPHLHFEKRKGGRVLTGPITDPNR